MYLHYGMVTVAVCMFGVQFLFSDRYQKENGNTPASSLTMTFLSSLVGAVFLLVINRFSLGFTPFTLLTASVAAINSMLCTFCTLKSLGKVNLSLYSMFSMLGGMLLPMLAGIVFYNEPVTLGLVLCVVLVAIALALSVSKSTQKGGWLYFIGVFVFNGMAGVISKFFESASFPKANPASYSIYLALVMLVLSGTVLLCMGKRVQKPNKKAVLAALSGGTLNQLANYLLLVALAVLPASVQYSFVTGGVIIVSTVISALSGQKPSVRECLGVAISFAGILLLIIL